MDVRDTNENEKNSNPKSRAPPPEVKVEPTVLTDTLTHVTHSSIISSSDDGYAAASTFEKQLRQKREQGTSQLKYETLYTKRQQTRASHKSRGQPEGEADDVGELERALKHAE